MKIATSALSKMAILFDHMKRDGFTLVGVELTMREVREIYQALEVVRKQG